MKISKRVIVFFVGIVLCCVLNCNYVFADNILTYYISEKINADKTLTATISFSEDTAAAGTIKLSYNTDNLELLSAEKGTSKAKMITLNDNEPGVVTINFLNAEDVIKDDTNIAVLKFSINSDEISEYDINVESFKLYNLDSKLLSDNTTTVPVYKLDKENIPADMSVTSRDEADSHQPSETSAEKSDREAPSTESQSADDDSKNSSSQPQEKSNVSASTEDASAVQQSTPEQNISEEKEASDDNNSPEMMVQESKGELSTAQSQSNADMIQDNTVLTVIVLSAVVLIAACTAIVIIKKQNSKKETGGQQNEK